MPRLPQDRADAAQRAGLIAVPVSLPAFFDAARRAVEHRPVPLIEGDLRHIGDRLTFLLPGTLSTRTYPKQANVRGQTMLTDWTEPLGVLSPSPEGPGLLRHAWELMVQNAPHNSVCGCSTDDVHEQNIVRAACVKQLAEHLSARALHRLGLRTQRTRAAATGSTEVAVLNPHARPVTQGVEVDIVTDPGQWPVALHDPTGRRWLSTRRTSASSGPSRPTLT